MPTIKHAKQVDLVAHPPDGVSVVQFDDWNEEHEIEQETGRVLGRASPGSGPTEELTPSQARSLLELGNAATKNTGTGSNDVAAGNHSHATATTSAAGFMSSTDKQKLDGIEAGADVTDAGNVGAAIHGASAKATPVDADTVALIDSAASNALKKLSWSNIKSTLKTYFDTLYATASHTHAGATTSAAGFMSASDKSKLDGIAAGAQVNTVTSVAGKTGAVTLAKDDVGLGNVDNTSDATKQSSFLSVIRDGVDSSMDTLAKMVSVFTSALAAKADTSSLGTIAGRNYSSGTADPSGGVDGDLYLKRTS